MDPRPAPNVETDLAVREQVDEETYLRTLDEVNAAMQAWGRPYCFIGGLASTIYGRDRLTHDLDLFVPPDLADDALTVLAANGFDVERSDPEWIYKAAKRGLMVDVIFQASDGTTLDAELARRVRVEEYAGLRLPLIPPEDLLLTKVSAFREDTARQWFDCLGIIEHAEHDWAYLVERALPKPHRITALLIWPQGNRACVPGPTLEKLTRAVLGRPGGEAVA